VSARELRTWPAVFAPALALVDQSVAYALVPWSCAHQQTVWLHATHAIFLVAILATLVAPWSRLLPAEPPSSPDPRRERQHFFALMGVLLALLSATVVAAMWATQYWLPPCAS
jgi:hypothetical protein